MRKKGTDLFFPCHAPKTKSKRPPDQLPLTETAFFMPQTPSARHPAPPGKELIHFNI